MSAINHFQVRINKKAKNQTTEELQALDQTQLIEKIRQLEAHNRQLKNLLQKTLDGEHKTQPQPASKEDAKPAEEQSNKKKKRVFDFANTHKRHVLLKLLYFGWDYQGFVIQEDSNATIEHNLFNALQRTCLIEARATANYHRCGRTDKGVSAFCQVISIDLRSKFKPEEQLNAHALQHEIDYCGILNKVLPPNTQCIAWMPLRSAVYSARFDCVARTYRYYFPLGNLNIEAMRAACLLLEGSHDFRNFCKMDVQHGVTNFRRHLHKASIESCDKKNLQEQHIDGYQMYFLEIKASAFLWHQIRCIVTLLLLIGEGKEQLCLIKDLLNVEKHPCKPVYKPALALPLNLFHCDFAEHAQPLRKTASSCNEETKDEEEIVNSNEKQEEEEEVNEAMEMPTNSKETDTMHWIYNREELDALSQRIQNQWTQSIVKSSMIRNVLQQIEEILDSHFGAKEKQHQAHALYDDNPNKQHRKMLDRERCESLENRIEHYTKRQRLVLVNDVTAEKEAEKPKDAMNL